MSIRVRLALAYAAALAVSLLLVGLVVWWRQGDALRSALEGRLTNELVDLEAAVASEGTEAVAEPGDHPDDLFVAVFDPDGRLVAAGPGAPADLAAPAAIGDSQVMLADGPHLLLAGEVGEGLTGVAGSSLVPLADAQAVLAGTVLAAGVVAALASVAGGWWLAGRVLGPVGAMTEEAAAIGDSDLDRRLPVSARGDELDALATTLNGMLDRIATGVRRQRSFLAAAAHDLRTPVTALQTELELVDRPDADEAELRAAVAEARADAVRLTELTSSLLALVSAAEDGRASVHTTTPLADLVAAAIRFVAPLCACDGVVIREEVEPVTVEVDRVRLEQALRNLLVNAVTYSPARGIVDVVGRVETEGDAEASRTLVIDVMDRGPGMSDAAWAEAFRPFTRGADARGDGSGLGLATALAAVEAHGGTIRPATRPGGGTRMTVSIPLRTGDGLASGPETRSRMSSTGHPAPSGEPGDAGTAAPCR